MKTIRILLVGMLLGLTVNYVGIFVYKTYIRKPLVVYNTCTLNNKVYDKTTTTQDYDRKNIYLTNITTLPNNDELVTINTIERMDYDHRVGIGAAYINESFNVSLGYSYKDLTVTAYVGYDIMKGKTSGGVGLAWTVWKR